MSRSQFNPFSLVIGILVVACSGYLVADPILSRVWDVEIVAERDQETESCREGCEKVKDPSWGAVGSAGGHFSNALNLGLADHGSVSQIPPRLSRLPVTRGPPTHALL